MIHCSPFHPGLMRREEVKNWRGSTNGDSRLFVWNFEQRRQAKACNVRLEKSRVCFGAKNPVLISSGCKYSIKDPKEGGDELW